MKTIIVSPEIEEAVSRMSNAEAASLFRALLLSAPASKQERISRIRSEAGRKGNAVRWHGEDSASQNIANHRKKENEKEKNQKNKEKESEENKNNLISYSGKDEWLNHLRQLCQDTEYLEQFIRQEDLTREQIKQYLKVFAYNLKERYPQHHWQNHGEFRRHFQNWYRLPINSQCNIAQQYEAIAKQEAMRQRKALREQQEQEERRRQEQEWEEHKRRACACPEDIAARLARD